MSSLTAGSSLLRSVAPELPSSLRSSTRMSKQKATKEEETLTRIAIVNSDKCKPKKCKQECKRSCPVVRMGKSQSHTARAIALRW